VAQWAPDLVWTGHERNCLCLLPEMSPNVHFTSTHMVCIVLLLRLLRRTACVFCLVIVLTAHRSRRFESRDHRQLDVTVMLYLYSGDAPFESPPGRRISVTLMWFSIFKQKNSGLVISLVQESFSITFQFIIQTSSSYLT